MFRICRRIMGAFPPAATAHRGKSGRSLFFGTGPRQENMPLDSDRDAGVDREVHPRVPDAWMDSSKDKISCEININRYVMYTPPQPLGAIDAELKEVEEKILCLLREVTE